MRAQVRAPGSYAVLPRRADPHGPQPGRRGSHLSSTVYALPDARCPARSRVTLPDGRQTTAIAALTRDGGGLPTPDHLEVQLQ
ncbi:hypothetical protein ABZ626_28335 [Streptomyces longispororuber]|uniref:hypothetical protein n=1 Tax=Streptomyces longispororuber TaxID=68230 RepID=UPI0033EADF7F